MLSPIGRFFTIKTTADKPCARSLICNTTIPARRKQDCYGAGGFVEECTRPAKPPNCSEERGDGGRGQKGRTASHAVGSGSSFLEGNHSETWERRRPASSA